MLTQRINVNLPIADMYFADLTRDIYSDLVVAAPRENTLPFLKTRRRGLCSARYIASQVPEAHGVLDVNRDGQRYRSSILADGQMQIFINEDALGDPPHPPTAVKREILPSGRQSVAWEAPELDEQLGRTTGYSIFRSGPERG